MPLETRAETAIQEVPLPVGDATRLPLTSSSNRRSARSGKRPYSRNWSRASAAAEGLFDVRSETDMAFTPGKTKVGHTIAFKDVTELEYGQKVGRRVAGWAPGKPHRPLLQKAKALPHDQSQFRND